MEIRLANEKDVKRLQELLEKYCKSCFALI